MISAIRNRLAALLVPAVLAGCATMPTPLQGQFRPLAANQAAASGAVGAPVRWGGVIIAVEPEPERTCIQVLARPLSERSGRPLERDISDGRFLACRAGFYDPEVFTQGREVTVTGSIVAVTPRPVGNYEYAMPELAAEVIYLWPPRVDYDHGYYYGPWSPWYGSWAYPRFYGGFYHHPRPRPVKPRPQRSRSD